MQKKLFWLTCTILSGLALLSQVYTLYLDVSSFPITVSLKVQPLQSIPFPVVTVCNSNKLAKLALQNYNFSEGSILKDLEEFERLSLVSKNVYAAWNASENRSFEDPAVYKECSIVRNGTQEDKYHYKEKTSFVQYNANTEETTEIYKIATNWDYSEELYPDNEFQCDDGSCISHILTCNGVADCTDASDESVELCGACLVNEYECRDGTCISAKLRCDGVFHCPDGSDEEYQWCDINLITNQSFICCNKRKMIPYQFSGVYDKYDDCESDKSDRMMGEYDVDLGLIQFKNGSHYADHPWLCTKQGIPYANGGLIYVGRKRFADGVEDCYKGSDEFCTWKVNLINWTSPTESDTFRKFRILQDTRQASPYSLRWYTTTTSEETKNLGHQLEDMILDCSFQNKDCSENTNVAIEYYQHHNYGNCYSYIATENVHSPGREYGLKLLFNLETYNMLGTFTEGAGLKMFLTKPTKEKHGHLVDLTSEFNLSPGSEHWMEVQPTVYEILPDPYGDCETYGESDSLKNFKTRNQCETVCKNMRNMEECGCVDDVTFEGGVLCEWEDVEGRACVDRESELFDPTVDCNCPTACTRYEYVIKSSQLQWPLHETLSTMGWYNSTSTTIYLQDVILRDFYKDNLQGTRVAQTKASSTFGKVRIFFNEIQETIIEERPVYTVVGVLSNLGGLLGLYLGFSILTVLEIVELIWDYIGLIQLKLHHWAWNKKEKKLTNN